MHQEEIEFIKFGVEPWWCPTCQKYIPGEQVTYDETHDPSVGGCGQPVE